MASGNTVSTMATRITIDDMQAVSSIKGLKNQVNTLMNSWKAQNAMLKSVGDNLGAAKARYEGLGDSIKKQQEYIEKLKNQMSTLDTSTNKGSEAYARLGKQLSMAQKQLANMSAQQDRAKNSLNYYTNGIDKTKKSLSEMTTSSNLMIEKLKAEGKTYQANYQQSKLYANQLDKMQIMHKKLESSLTSIADDQGKESKAYKQTAQSLQKLDTEMAKTKEAQSKLNSSFINTHASVAKMRDSYDKASTSVKKVGTGVKEMAGKVVSGTAIAVTAVGGLSAGFVAVSKSASEMQNTYKVTANLLETGGEKTAEVTKNVAEMQKDGRKYSLEYGKSQKEIAEAYQDLVKRGDTSKQALGAMRSEIQASVASGDDLKDVTSVTSNVMESFGMKVDKNGKALESTSEMTKRTKVAVNDLAYAADKTSTSFQDLGVGMSYVGATAHGAGISLSETASAMGILSNNGVEADKAGTGLRKVINSLSTAVKSIDNKDNVLNKLGIKKEDIVDSKGNLKSLSDVMGVLGDKTKSMGTSDKNVVFNSLFGTTGQQAGMILAENASKLKELNKEVANSSKNDYVGKLAEKNMGTAENAMKRFKAVGQDVQMTLASAVLPTVSQMAESMSKVADTKGFRDMVKTVGNGMASVGDKLQSMFKYIEKNSGAFTSMGKSIATIVGQLGSGIWESFKSTISIISKGILSAFGDKSTGNVANDLAKALADIAKHKDAIKTIGEVIGTVFIAKKVSGFAKSLYDVGSAISGIAKSISKTKGGNFLSQIFGLSDKKKISSEVSKAAGDIADDAVNSAKKKTGKTNVFKNMFKKSSKTSSDVAKDAGDLAKDATGAAEKSAGKTSFLSKIFAKTPVAEQGALAAGTRMAAKVGNGLNIGIQAIDLTKAIFEKNGKKKFEDIGSSAGSLIGTGIGTAFGGPVGGMIGGMIGNTLGKVIGDAAHGAVKWWNKAGGWSGITKSISKTVSGWGKTISKGCNSIVKDWNSLNKKMASGVESMASKVGKKWNGLWSDISKTVSKNAKNISKEANKIWNGLQKDLKSATKNAGKTWNSFWKDTESKAKKSNIGKIVKKTFDDVYNNIKNSNAKSTKDVADSQNKQSKSFRDAGNNNKKYVSSTANAIIKTVNDQANKTISAANREYSQRTKIADKQYNAIVKKANQTHDNAVKAANDKYNKIVNAANKEYSGTDKASTQQRDAIIDHARKQRDNAVKSADEQRDKVVRHAERQRDSSITAAEKQRNETVNKANDQRDKIKDAASGQSQGVVGHMTKQANSTMKANSDQAGGLSKIWKNIIGFFNKLTKPFGVKEIKADSISSSYSEVSGLAYASGGGVENNGKALVGEAGPELRYKPYSGKFDVLGTQGAQLADLEAGDEILNAEDTAKLLSGGYIGTLPGYAKGTSDLSSFMKKVSEGASDLFNDVKDDALKVIKNIGKPIEKIKDIAKKAFNLDSVKDLGDFPRDLSKGAVNKSIESIGNFISKLIDKVKSHEESSVGGVDAKNIGAGAKNWTDTIKKVAKDMKVDLSDSDISLILWRINKESGGNQSIKQQIDDVNSRAGHPAQGLLQYVPSTFASWMVSGHNNILSGEDQLYAMFNDSNWRHDIANSGGWGPSGHRRFANGGIADVPSIFGEDGPEMAIPLASPKRSRGYKLLGKVVSMFAAEEQAKTPILNNNNDRIEELLEQNNKLMEMLINIANGQLDIMNSGSNNTQVCKDAFYRTFGMDQKRSNFQSY
nr:phage tail tape measure protein [uncultured Ligilactobacillus sp.]